MILKEGKISISRDDVVAVVKTNLNNDNGFNFFLRGGHMIEVNGLTNEEEKEKIIATFFERKTAGTWGS